MMRKVRTQRGFGLLDAMIALAILAFGLLGMTRLQSKTVQSAIESQTRQRASQFADELISTAILDKSDNRFCYTVPAAGACPSTAAAKVTTDWVASTKLGIGPGTTITSAFDKDFPNRLVIKITWTGKLAVDGTRDTRTLEAITDVRPPPL